MRFGRILGIVFLVINAIIIALLFAGACLLTVVGGNLPDTDITLKDIFIRIWLVVGLVGAPIFTVEVVGIYLLNNPIQEIKNRLSPKKFKAFIIGLGLLIIAYLIAIGYLIYWIFKGIGFI